jgi:acetyl esterase
MIREFLLLTCLLVFAPVFGAQAPSPAEQVSPSTPIGTAHVYKTVNGRDLHVYTASPDPKLFPAARPVIISIHGGGFTAGTPASFNPFAEFFLKRGIASAEVEYRLQKGGGAESLDDQIRDARSAVRWVRAHAGELGVDPARIILMGGSAGGYLVESSILLQGPDDLTDDKGISTIPFAAVLYNPALNGAPGSPMEKLMGDRWQQLSPLHRVSKLQPPTIILHGDKDTTVGVTDVVEFAHELHDAGVPVTMYLYPGQKHAFFNHPPYTLASLLDIDRFLTGLGLTAGPAPRQPYPLPAQILPLDLRTADTR